MRLHRLTVSAFGPFAGTEAVDFDALARGGLFLLHGATGAGKTSVLDAVCFALYGEVPGGRPRHRLRSDHAGPETPTEVRLELTLGGRRLELTRRPEYERPKKRGSGTTPERAQSLLREWREEGAQGAGWRPVSTSHQEIGAEVLELLGMSREQFCQVVLLPQGDFARFLHAGAQDRAELLGRLFGTGRFRDAEGWLDERRRVSEKAYAAVRGDLDQLVQRLSEAAGGVAPPPTGERAAVAEVLGWAAGLRSEARERLDVAHSAHALAAGRQEAARRAASSAARLAERQRRHRQALLRQRELERTADAHRADLDRLALALRAQPVAPLLELRVHAEAAFRRAVEVERAERAAMGRDALLAPLVAEPVPALARAEAELREELGGLRSLRDAERRLTELRREQRRLRADQEEAEGRQEEAGRWIEEWPAERQRWEAAAERARAAGVRADQLAPRVEAARRQAAAAGERDALGVAVADAERAQLTLREAAVGARERWLALREQRIAGMAAELAAQLEAGAPCPVCGSAEHPAPALPRPGQVTRADEEQAGSAVRAAEARADEAADRLRGLRECAAATAAAAGDGSVEELDAAAEQLAAEHAEALATAREALPATEELARLEREHHVRSAEFQQAGRRAAACAAALETLAAEEHDLTSRLSAALTAAPVPSALRVPYEDAGGGLHAGAGTAVAGRAGPPPDHVASRSASPGGVPAPRTEGVGALEERLTALARTADLLARAAEAARRAAEAERARDEAVREVAAQAARAGFADAAHAEQALLPEVRLAELRGRVEAYQAEQAGVAEQLADPEVTAAAGLPEADTEAAEAALEVAERQARSAYAGVEAARTRCAALARLGAELDERARRLAPLADEHATVEGLHALVRGTAQENRLRMSLETYVLAARLEQVAAAASTRLLRMSGGRYTLRHSDERARGGARSGLGLRVLDAWTGVERDTATLSGGESFFASLALALGLSDVVTDEAGGRPLDTLFIDEGFGSLDEETLDDVLDVLDQLRERDRAVGIVSHVGDLRRRIPVQLQVRKERAGSTLRLRTAGG
jgi:exonuclease SbcC